VCFSAEVSFGAAVVLGAMGVRAITSCRQRRHLLLAAVPLLFAAQQAVEGLLWLLLADTPFGKTDHPLVRVFLAFSLFLWPAYIPIAFLAAEAERWRVAAQAVTAMAGLALGSYMMSIASLRAVDVCMTAENLYYWIQFDPDVKRVLPIAYGTTVTLPVLVSSINGAKLLAAATATSLVAAGMTSAAGFVSLWCFFAAVLSGVMCVVVGRPKWRPSEGAGRVRT
jgi:hypothetical protein